MNKNLWRRRQLLYYFGIGAILASTKSIVDLGLNNTHDSTTSLNSNSSDFFSPNAIAAQPSVKALPEFQGIESWINSAPLSIANLKGNVILVQFWTFACINCQRTLPYITKWHQQYAKQGLKIIGIHTPEFAFERDVNNIKKALRKNNITYPVPVDNQYKTWNAYNNEYWPHLFLADRQGFLRYDHIGEGAYDQTEQTIRKLLA